MGRLKPELLATVPLLFSAAGWAQNSTLALGGTGPAPYFQGALTTKSRMPLRRMASR